MKHKKLIKAIIPIILLSTLASCNTEKIPVIAETEKGIDSTINEQQTEVVLPFLGDADKQVAEQEGAVEYVETIYTATTSIADTYTNLNLLYKQPKTYSKKDFLNGITAETEALRAIHGTINGLTPPKLLKMTHDLLLSTLENTIDLNDLAVKTEQITPDMIPQLDLQTDTITKIKIQNEKLHLAQQ
jgi:hypothetical protein